MKTIAMTTMLFIVMAPLAICAGATPVVKHPKRAPILPFLHRRLSPPPGFGIDRGMVIAPRRGERFSGGVLRPPRNSPFFRDNIVPPRARR